MDEIDDLAQRHALEVQISEFGQIPKQLFNQPHVPRMVNVVVVAAAAENEQKVKDNGHCLMDGGGVDGSEKGLRFTDNVQLEYEYQPHRLDITAALYDADTQTIYSTSQDGTMKSFDCKKKQQTGSVNLGPMPISSCVRIPDTELFVLGCWDNTM